MEDLFVVVRPTVCRAARLGFASALVGVAMCGCSQEAGPKPSASTSMASSSPSADDSDSAGSAAFALDPGVKKLAEISGGQTSIDLGPVKRGTLHIVIECTGEGTASYTYEATGALPVPCTKAGFTTYNEASFSRRQKDITLHFSGDQSNPSIRALIGWTPKYSKPPVQESPDSST